MSTPKVLFFSRDPGATNQMVAVHEYLCGTGEHSEPAPGPAIEDLRTALGLIGDQMPEAVVTGKKFALDVWRAAGIQAQEWKASTPAAITQYLADHNIAMVITGTDDIDEPDTVSLWQTAQQCGLPVAVFLDNLVNLDVRFRTRKEKLITPDRVFTLDTHSKEELAEAGIPEDRLRVTKNLHLARLAKLAKTHAGARDELRKAWHAEDTTQIILFASENTAEMAALGRPAPWDEHALLRRLIDDLAQGNAVGGIDPNKIPVMIVIRPHPRDSAGKYDDYRQTDDPTVRISGEGAPLEAILAADLVVGMDSALLFEAQALGRPALSLVADSKFNARPENGHPPSN